MKKNNQSLRIAIMAASFFFMSNSLLANIDDGVYFLRTESRELSIAPNPSMRTNALAQLSASINADNPAASGQLIIVKRMSTDLFQILSVGFGGALSVPFRNNTTHIGGAFFMPWINREFQLWKISERPDGTVRLVLSVDNISLITSATGSSGQGTNIVTGIGGIRNNDIWRLERVGTSTGRLIEKTTWFTGLNNIFSSARLRLNNFTPIKNENDPTGERAFIKRNDAFLELNMEGRPTRFDIPLDMIEAGPDKMCKMYISDWNTNSISTSLPNNTFKVDLKFENRGKEIVSNCYNNLNCGAVGCPTFDFDNASFEIVLIPVINASRITYTSTVKFNTNVSEVGPCVNNFFAMFCPTNREGIIRNTIEQTVSNQIQGRTVKPLIETLLQRAINPTASETHIIVTTSGNIVIW